MSPFQIDLLQRLQQMNTRTCTCIVIIIIVVIIIIIIITINRRQQAVGVLNTQIPSTNTKRTFKFQTLFETLESCLSVVKAKRTEIKQEVIVSVCFGTVIVRVGVLELTSEHRSHQGLIVITPETYESKLGNMYGNDRLPCVLVVAFRGTSEP